jgi:hypothetical protein
MTIIDSREWAGRGVFTGGGALVYYLKAVPWAVEGFSVKTHGEYLFALQSRLESGQGLIFSKRQYLIEARKD